MVALALLMMLAVFAALFLTSSRFDMAASTADLDAVRMDLYAEGMAQYIQTCMVAGLWGFDDLPLNNDGTNPWTTPAPTVIPGPDSPYDYYGGERSLTLATGASAIYYPNFWLTDPRIQTVAANQVFVHAAFDPVHTVPFFDPSYPTDLALQWQCADLNNDARADTPWTFIKPLGNGLYIRAAIRVEDTSSRVNLNVARHPLFLGAANTTVDELQVLRPSLYPGYPYFLNDAAGTSLFPLLTNAAPKLDDPNVSPRWVDQLGAFLSELDLAALINGVGGVSSVNTLGSGVAAMPGRYGTANAWPECPFSQATALAPNANLRSLLGDPSLAGTTPTAGNPGRLGNLLRSSYNKTAGTFWDTTTPAPATWQTYDPDGLVRRINNAATYAGLPTETDRPFGTDETFDLMSLHAQQVAGAPPGEDLRYRSGTGSTPVSTRLERIWPDILISDTAAIPLQYRRLFTTYSWTLNLCPYGADPYFAANGGSHTFRKVAINTCTGREFEEALVAAQNHPLYGAALPNGEVSQLVANLLDYRDRPMAEQEFLAYLNQRLTRHLITNPASDAVPSPDDPMLEWDEQAWQSHVLQATGNPWAAAIEIPYLTMLLGAGPGSWITLPATLRAEILARASYDSPSKYTAHVGPVTYGLDRFPFITEVYARITNYNPPGTPPSDLDKETAWASPGNQFAIELYNPYTDPVNLENYELVVVPASGNPPLAVPLSRNYAADISVPPYPAATKVTTIGTELLPGQGRLVITNDPTILLAGIPAFAAPTLVIYPGSRVYLRCPAFTIDPGAAVKRKRSADNAILDEVQSVTNNMTYPPPPVAVGNAYSWGAARWDLRGGFWLHSNNAWIAGSPVTPANLGLRNGTGPVAPFYGLASIANCDRASFLSPADLQNLLRVGPDTESGGLQSATFKVDAVWPGGDPRIPLFHRSYLPGASDTIANQVGNGAGVFQSLMDFVTVTDFLADGVDNDGNGIVDTDLAGNPDLSELRVPGRLNVNSIGSDFLQLDAMRIPLLLFVDPAKPRDATFWQRLIEFRDMTSWFATGRDNAATGTAGTFTGYANHVGIEQLGDLCNLQYATDPTFIGFWQDRASLNLPGHWPPVLDTNTDNIPDFLLPSQHARRFARNANLLTTRSDTYMVTMRVEIVRPVYDGGTLRHIDALGQKDFMYLMDRSYCTKAPQRDFSTDELFNGRVRTDFVPPRVWRMSIPKYVAHGG